LPAAVAPVPTPRGFPRRRPRGPGPNAGEAAGGEDGDRAEPQPSGGHPRQRPEADRVPLRGEGHRRRSHGPPPPSPCSRASLCLIPRPGVFLTLWPHIIFMFFRARSLLSSVTPPTLHRGLATGTVSGGQWCKVRNPGVGGRFDSSSISFLSPLSFRTTTGRIGRLLLPESRASASLSPSLYPAPRALVCPGPPSSPAGGRAAPGVAGGLRPVPPPAGHAQPPY